MWPMKRQPKKVSRSEIRNRVSIKPKVDGLEDRKLLSFSTITYQLFPKATAIVAGKQDVKGEVKSEAFLRTPLDYNYTADEPRKNAKAHAFASMQATAYGRNGSNLQGGTIIVLNDDLNNTVVRNAATKSRAQTDFTYSFKSTSPFTFSCSGNFLWTWGIAAKKSGSLGSIEIHRGGATGRVLAESRLDVNEGVSTAFVPLSSKLLAGDYTITLKCVNDTDATNTSTVNGTVNWSIASA